MVRPKTFAGVISHITHFGTQSSLYTLSLDDEIIFSPGQFIMVPVKDKEGKSIRRAYSIASSPSKKKQLELLLTRHEGGIASEFFKQMKEGDSLELLGPMGVFTVREPISNPIYFIATGAGLAPFRSMIHSLLKNKNTTHLVLLFGFRHEEDYLCKEELEKLMKTHKNVSVIPTCSQPKGSWRGLTGRVTAHLDAIECNEKTQAYLCGSTSMINEMIPLLLQKGMKREHIFFEKWG